MICFVILYIYVGTYAWDEEKNGLLKITRGVNFDDVKIAILNGKILDDFPNPHQDRYPGQRMLIIEIDDYAYLVPYIENKNIIFLKTIIPNSKATKKYLRKENNI
jgi:hypothetical protein